MSNFLEKIKYGISEVARSRTSVAIIVFSVMAAILVQRLFYLQIVRGEDYAEDYELQIQKSKEIEGTRGNIYDRNGEELAVNRQVFTANFNASSLSTEEINDSALELIKMIDGAVSDGDEDDESQSLVGRVEKREDDGSGGI